MTLRLRTALAVGVSALLTGGCHQISLQPVTLSPAPRSDQPGLLVEVTRAAMTTAGCLGQTSICAPSHLGVGITLDNQTTGPVSVEVDEAQLLLATDPSDPKSARSVFAAAAGTGPLAGQIDDRSEAGTVALAPGERREVWVDFTGFAEGPDTGYRPRLTLSVPARISGRAENRDVVLVDPSRGTPRWEKASRSHWSGQIGGLWLNVPGRGVMSGVSESNRDAFGVEYGIAGSTGPWFARYGVGLGWLTGINGRDDLGMTLAFSIGRVFSKEVSSGGRFSLAPTVGLQTAFFEADDKGARERTGLVGPTAGLSLFVDRDRAIGGPLPFAPVTPRHGSIFSLQLLYVHWFGKVAEVAVSGPGFLANFSVALSLP